MKTTLAIVIAVVLGLAAAVFNFVSLSSSSRTTDFIVSKVDLELYDEFQLDDFERAPIPARFADSVKGCAMLYSDRSALVGQRATRKIKPGSLILYGDAPTVRGAVIDLRADYEAALPVSLEGIKTPPGMMKVGDEIEFRIPVGDPLAAERLGIWIGPFRLVSVGPTITRDPDPEEGLAVVNHVAVAYDTRPNSPQKARFDQLIDFIDRSQSDERAKLVDIRRR